MIETLLSELDTLERQKQVYMDSSAKREVYHTHRKVMFLLLESEGFGGQIEGRSIAEAIFIAENEQRKAREESTKHL